MAYASTTHNAARTVPAAAGLSAAIVRLSERFARYQLYRRTIAEMDAMNDCERAELGVSRKSARTAAYEAVYGM